ncbi:protein FAM227A isoform X2 [Dromiciops gliroides]|uniref:protein FAM227A isoform X2 n=1 Tax=Dromiciops gliroides TaxID=33562 RepID=UPI001CC53FF4|nr:protein FAM227A isoform X2 [Dromiciops gliroides]XP_043821261.1 protein FAM227A isoform X2 [Dromiciops gliroides]XP_043821262.1 protein FAM227A isoform X2 [Dromiciops gliroides]XP_043821264.1 protein FAM227A isoform X2 [Dromiciops gliroides]
MPLSAAMLEVINLNAVPMIALDYDLSVPPTERQRLHQELKTYVKENPPLCIVGSMGKLNRKIEQIDLKTRLHKTSIHSNFLVIEKLEAEKKLREQQRILEEKEKTNKGKKKQHKFFPLTPSTSNVPHPGPKKRTQKDGLAELYQAPEYNEALPNELPNGVNYCDMVGNVIRAQGGAISGKVFCAPTEMIKFFASPYSKAIVLDCFWWMFHERYDPNKMIQRKLFDRISKNYAHLLVSMPKSSYKEIILRSFSSLLSQTLYTSFCTCFPQSWFDNHEFKSSICNTMTQWIGGTFPSPKSYVHWNYFELEPVRFRREELMRGKEKFSGNNRQKIAMQISKSEPRSKSQRQASKKVREITEMRMLERSAQNESHPACKGPEFSKNLFSITGNSPLIVHYLQQHNSYLQAGQDIFMVRHDMTKTMPEGTATYRDVIRQVRANMKKLSKDTKCLRKMHWKEWKVFEQSQKDLQAEFIRKVRDISANALEKKKMNQYFIPPPVPQEELSDQFGKIFKGDELHCRAAHTVPLLRMKS